MSGDRHTPTIVILGGGYSGLFAAQRARRRWRAVRPRIILVHDCPSWTERNRLHQVAVGDRSVRQWSYERFFRGTALELREGRATHIDPDAKTVTVRLTDGAETTMSYTVLIYAVGSQVNFGDVPGAARHCQTVDDDTAARSLHRRLGVLGPGATVNVIGGGLVGIEAATEIAETHPALSVHLWTSDVIHRGLNRKAAAHLDATINRFGIHLHEHVRVRGVDESAVLTDAGSHRSDVTVWAGGFAVPQLAAAAGIAVDPRGRVLVDDAMRSVSHRDVFAAGDSAHVTDFVGAPVRMSGFTAIILGAAAGANAARLLQARTLRPLNFGYLFLAVSLGRRDGIVQFLTRDDKPTRTAVTGRPAAWFKESAARYLVVGSLQLERLMPYFFLWRPGLRRQTAEM